MLVEPQHDLDCLQAWGPRCPLDSSRVSMASAGFPGIKRGRKKLKVSAAHSVMRKNPTRRTM